MESIEVAGWVVFRDGDYYAENYDGVLGKFETADEASQYIISTLPPTIEG